MKVTAREIEGLFATARGIPMVDETYWLPDDDWLREWYRNYRHELNWTPKGMGFWRRAFGMRGWQYARHQDCDDFSLRALDMANRMFVFTSRSRVEHAETVAVLEVIGDLPTPHAMNAVVLPAAGTLEVWLVEPQDIAFRRRRATANEIRRIQWVRG